MAEAFATMETLLEGVTPAQARRAPGGGEWSVHEILDHLVETHPRFVRRVNAGFMEVVSRTHIRLRVHERDAGETLACGTGACAAVVAGIRLGWLDSRVDVDAHGGKLTVEWAGGANDSVFLIGPAATVFEGEIEL